MAAVLLAASASAAPTASSPFARVRSVRSVRICNTPSSRDSGWWHWSGESVRCRELHPGALALLLQA